MPASAKDPFYLARFVGAQAKDYGQALAEPRAGQKQSHWMWYVFPQLRGLGLSEASEFYGISSLAEARAYLEHEVLGPRLLECIEAISAFPGRDAEQVLGRTDAMKFRSCLTLFANAASEPRPFVIALDRYFDGHKDQKTLELLGAQSLA